MTSPLYPSISLNSLNESHIELHNLNQSANNDSYKSVGSNVIEIKKVADAIRQGKEIINDSSKGDHIVLFWGFSGTGKSSAIIILNGQKVKGYHKGDPILVEANPTNNERGVKIETLVKAGTIYPAVLDLRYELGKQKVMLWDMPGIGETRGATQSLINSYFIHRIFQFQTSVKLIFTIEFSEVVPNKRGAHLEKTLTDLTKVLGDFSNYHYAVAIMITKVPPINSQEDIIDFFKQILAHLPAINENKHFRPLLEKIVSKQIPLLIVKQPDMVSFGKVSLQNAVFVTHQYVDFIEKTYHIISTKLKPASFPKLYSPAMSSNQIIKCKPIVDETHRQIEECFPRVTKNLSKFITSIFEGINAHFNTDSFQKIFQQYKMVKEFITKILKKASTVKSRPKKEIIKMQFDELKLLFENLNFDCKKNKEGQLECTPMATLNDNYIMVRFLNTLSFEGTDIILQWQNESQIIIRLFDEIGSMDLQTSLSSQVNHLNENIKQSIVGRFKLFLRDLEQQNSIMNWKRQFKMFPSFMLKVTKFDTSTNSLDYFSHFYQNCQKSRITKTAPLKSIIQILKMKQAYFPERLPDEFINSEIKPIFTEQVREKINMATNYQNWQAIEVNRVIADYQNQNPTSYSQQSLSLNEKIVYNKLVCEKQAHQKNIEMYENKVEEKDRLLAKEKQTYQQSLATYLATAATRDNMINQLTLENNKLKSEVQVYKSALSYPKSTCCCQIY